MDLHDTSRLSQSVGKAERDRTEPVCVRFTQMPMASNTASHLKEV